MRITASVLRRWFMPEWWSGYQRRDFRFDLVAGLTVGTMVIPQAMAYAMLAGIPPIYGLYASTLPAILYSWFGTSRQLSVAPTAMVSLLTASGVGLIAQEGFMTYAAMVAMLTMMVGLIQFLLGVSRLGFLMRFLSNPVMLGFTSAAAIIIALSQIRFFLGINVPQSQYLQNIVSYLFSHITETHLLTLLISCVGLMILLIFQRLMPKFPAPLILVAIGIAITMLFHLDQEGVRVIGHIPQGLPAFSGEAFHIHSMAVLFPSAFAVALISIMESTATARALWARHKDYVIRPNRELLALGLANLTSGLLQASPVSGGMARSTVNDEAGATSGMSSLVSAMVVLTSLLFLTPVLYYLPQALLAATILAAIHRLIRIRDARRLWRIDQRDFWMMLVTFLGTLFFGISWGIGIGVMLSLAWIIFQSSYPHFAELGRVPGTTSFRNLERFTNLERPAGIMIFRFDSPLYFVNASRFREILYQYLHRRTDDVRVIILDMESVFFIDSTAVDMLADIVEEISLEHISIYFAEVKGPVRDKLHASGLTIKIGEDHFYLTIDQALQSLTTNPIARHTAITLQTNRNRPE